MKWLYQYVSECFKASDLFKFRQISETGSRRALKMAEFGLEGIQAGYMRAGY